MLRDLWGLLRCRLPRAFDEGAALLVVSFWVVLWLVDELAPNATRAACDIIPSIKDMVLTENEYKR